MDNPRTPWQERRRHNKLLALQLRKLIKAQREKLEVAGGSASTSIKSSIQNMFGEALQKRADAHKAMMDAVNSKRTEGYNPDITGPEYEYNGSGGLILPSGVTDEVTDAHTEEIRRGEATYGRHLEVIKAACANGLLTQGEYDTVMKLRARGKKTLWRTSEQLAVSRVARILTVSSDIVPETNAVHMESQKYGKDADWLMNYRTALIKKHIRGDKSLTNEEQDIMHLADSYVSLAPALEKIDAEVPGAGAILRSAFNEGPQVISGKEIKKYARYPNHLFRKSSRVYKILQTRMEGLKQTTQEQESKNALDRARELAEEKLRSLSDTPVVKNPETLAFEARAEILARLRSRHAEHGAYLGDGLFDGDSIQTRAVELRKHFSDDQDGDKKYADFLTLLQAEIAKASSDEATKAAFDDSEKNRLHTLIQTLISAIPQRVKTEQKTAAAEPHTGEAKSQDPEKAAINHDWAGPEKKEFGAGDRQEAARTIMRSICAKRIPELNFANPAGLDAAISKVRKMGFFQRAGIYMAVSAAALGTVLALSAFAPALIGSLGLSGFIATKIGAGFAAGLTTRHIVDSMYGLGTNDRSLLGKLFLGRKEISAFEMAQISNGLEKAMKRFSSSEHHYAHETARRERYAREFSADGSVQAKTRDPFKIGINELMTSFETGKRREKWRQIGIPLALGLGATAYYHAGDITSWFSAKPSGSNVAGAITPGGSGPKGSIDPLTGQPNGGKGNIAGVLENKNSSLADKQVPRLRIGPNGQICFDYVTAHDIAPQGRITWESLTPQGQGYLRNSFYGNINCKEGTWGALRDVLGRPPHDVLSGLSGQQKQTLIQAFDGILENSKGAVRSVTGDFTDARHIVKRCGNFAELIGDGRARAHVFEFLKQGPVGQSILNERGDVINKLFNMARMVKMHT